MRHVIYFNAAIIVIGILVGWPLEAAAIKFDCNRLDDMEYVARTNKQIMDAVRGSFEDQAAAIRKAMDHCFAPVKKPAQPKRQGRSGGCVHTTVQEEGSTIFVTVRNRCGERRDINVCVLRKDAKFGPERNSARVEAGDFYRFNFINWAEQPFTYGVRSCSPGRSTASHHCPADCAPPGG